MATSSDYRRREESITLASEPAGESHELMTLNIGPHHPATHGVLRLLATLEGEVIRDIRPIIGYVHTGIEKTAEDKSYWKVIPVIERMDYLAYYFNAMAFCGAVETLLGVEVPPRAQYLRVIHLELCRIASHLLWLGTSALDLGAISMFWYCFRDREKILDLFEMSSGQRMHTRYIQVGGVMEDIPLGFAEKVREFCQDMPTRADQYADLLEKNEIVLGRLRGTGVVDQETMLGLGVTGPLLRATGQPVGPAQGARRTRAMTTSSSRSRSGPSATTTTATAVRHAELYESVKIIEQALDGLPEGPHITTDRKVALPPRHELATSMEALIHHFKLVTEGFRVPPGECYYPIEGPARRARLLRPRRRLGQAGARAHARPELHQPAGAQPHGPRRLHRRPDRDAGDARPDPRRDRPMSATPGPVGPDLTSALAERRGEWRRDPQTAQPVPRFGHGSRVPGWDEAVDLTKPPATIPDPATTPVPEALRAGIEASMAKYPDRRSAAIPALHLAQEEHGWCSPEAIDQVASVMRAHPGLPDERRDLLRHVQDRPRRTPRRLRVHEHLMLAARRRRAVRGDARGRARRLPTSTCARSSAWAPATSRRWPRSTASTSGRSPTEDAGQIVEDLIAGRAVLEHKQLRYRRCADPGVAEGAGEFAPPPPDTPRADTAGLPPEGEPDRPGPSAAIEQPVDRRAGSRP